MRPPRRPSDFGLRMAPRSLQRGPAAPDAPGRPGVITSAPWRTVNSTAWQTLISTSESNSWFKAEALAVAPLPDPGDHRSTSFDYPKLWHRAIT